ncbi:MAG: ADP-ribosylglycohydrolase family protein, partial [Planctomycetota bacterium]
MKGKKAITTVFAVISAIAALSVFPLPVGAAAGASVQSVQLSADTLADKIHGGLLGQVLGNLNGLKHEMKYINKPGSVEHYTPALPDGARTDDDTDLEWVYIVAMQRSGTIFIPPQSISSLWKSHINHHIWCSNNYARQLMDIDIDPPLTGCIALNPWAEFNISGQFLCESFGLIAPAMPQTAARIGLHYTHVGIEGEPAQTTQLFTTMIASAFITDDMENILNAGFSAVDPESQIRPIVADVRRWHRKHPLDWRTTRRLVRQKYSRHNGAMRDKNGYELNTAATIAALLYGQGDFVETLRTAFNFGWDADNNAATAATIVGVIKGHKWMQKQGWNIQDRYRNTTRESMPKDETISSFANR